MKHRYSRQHEPPAPVVRLGVAFPGESRRSFIEAKVDSGADLCTVPEELVVAMDLPPTRTVRARGFAGEPITVTVHLADLEVDGVTLDLAEVVPTRRPYALPGRNALAELVVVLDGPKSQLEIVRPSSRRASRGRKKRQID